MRRSRLIALALAALLAGVAAPAARAAGYLLVPMDLTQKNHLKAYGLAFHTLQAGAKVNWLLNYRGGASSWTTPNAPAWTRG